MQSPGWTARQTLNPGDNRTGTSADEANPRGSEPRKYAKPAFAPCYIRRTTMAEAPATTTRSHTGCCIVGGGPAGMMLGFLLARAGVEVMVLEKHADFLRDFRGDTIHPSTLEIMCELGL